MDGSITLKTKIDNSGIDGQLDEINKKIKLQEDKINNTKKSFDEINNSLKNDNSELNSMIHKYESLDSKIKGMQSKKSLNSSEHVELDEYIKKREKLGNSIDKVRQKINKEDEQQRKLTLSLKQQKLQYDQLIGKKQKLEVKEFQKNSNSIGRTNIGLKEGIKTLSRYALALFSVSTVYSALSSAASTWLNSNDTAAKQLSANIEYMKWAIGKALQPIIETLVNWMFKLLQIINILSTRIFGVNLFANASASAFKSIASSASSTAKSTKQVSQNLASWDKLDVLNKDNNSSGGSSGSVGPSLDFDNGTLSESTVNKVSNFADKLKKIWDNLEPIRKILKWLLKFSIEHPDIILTIIGGAKLISTLSKILGVGGATGTGLKGVLGALVAIAAIGTIVIEFKILYDEVKEAKKTFEATGKTADSVAKKQKKAQSTLVDYAKTLDTSTESSQNFINSMIQQGKKASENADELTKLRDEAGICETVINDLTGATDQQTKTFYAHIQATKTRIDTLMELHNQGKLNEEQTEQLKQLLEEYTLTLEGAGYTQDSVTQKFWTSEEQTKELKEEYKNASKALDGLGGSSDASKEKLGQLTGAMAAVPNKKTIQVDADTSSARSKLNNLFSKLKTSGLSAFGSAAIGLVSTLPRLAKGGIANNPGRGVDVNFAENGAEMILPLENNTEWMDTLADKIASRTGGDRPLNIKATGSLSQLIRLLKLELDKEDDRRGGSMIKGGTL